MDFQNELPEGIALGQDLLVELVVGNFVDVLDLVVVVNGDLRPAWLQLLLGRLPELLRHDGEVQAEVLDVPFVGLEGRGGVISIASLKKILVHGHYFSSEIIIA